jgi:hypothetical protein
LLQVILFTNRNLLVFNESDEQMIDLQGAIDCYSINPEKLRELLAHDCEFSIARWGKWRQDLTRREFEYLLGLRTAELDIADAQATRPHA